MKIYQEQCRLLYSDCDKNTNISLIKILEIVENCFSEVTSLMGCDNITLDNNYNSMWVIIKTKIKTFKTLKWQDELNIQSKVVNYNRVFAVFQTEIRNKNNELCIISISQCCVVDKTSFKFVRLSNIPFDGNQEEGDYTIELDDKIDGIEYDFNVGLSKIDYSNHLNNTKSVANFIDKLDMVNYDFITNEPFVLKVQYLQQAKLGDELKMIVYQTSNNCGFTIKKEDKEIIKLQIEVNK